MAKSLETTYFRENLDAYMDINGIKTYADLLLKIGRELDLKGDELYNFPEREKSNFSKMLKGTRPLKAEYIIPLEKILGVSLAKLLNEQLYVEPDPKEIPYLNGFRYYAHLNEYDRYAELVKMTTPSGELVIKNSDEFNKCFLDYVVEYNAINALRYLADHHNLRVELYIAANEFIINEHDRLYSSNEFSIPEMIINEDDPDLFNQVFRLRCNPILSAISDYSTFYNKEWFIYDVLNSPKILKSLFKVDKYSFSLINKGVEPKNGHKPDIELYSPLLKYCLKYSLSHLDEFKEQAIQILKFAIAHNKKTIAKLDPTVHHYTEYDYALYESFRVCRGSLFVVNEMTEDKEINAIIRELPKLNVSGT